MQLPEAWLVLWLTALANKRPWPVEYNQLDAADLALNAIALVAIAWILSRERRGALSKTDSDPMAATDPLLEKSSIR